MVDLNTYGNLIEEIIPGHYTIDHQHKCLYVDVETEVFSITGGTLTIKITLASMMKYDDFLNPEKFDRVETTYNKTKITPKTWDTSCAGGHEVWGVLEDINKDRYEQNYLIDVWDNLNYGYKRFTSNNFMYVVKKGHYGFNSDVDAYYNVIVDRKNIFVKKVK